jgi:hypothetical protein
MDERFFIYGDDVDWSLRIAQADFDILHAPAAELWHKGSAAMVNHSPMHDFHNVRSQLLLARKYAPWLFPLAVGYSFYRNLAPKVVRGQWGRLRAVVRAYAGIAEQLARGTAAEPADRQGKPTVTTIGGPVG